MHGFGPHSGGVDRYVTGLVNALRQAGHATPVCAFVGAPPNTGDDCSLGRADQNVLRRLAAIRRFLDRETSRGGNVMASHFSLYGLPARARRHLPHVVHFHGPWAMESAAEGQGRLTIWLKRQVELRVYRPATRCIVLSQAFATILAEQYGVAREKISIVPGGVDTAHFRPREGRTAARQRLGWPADVPIVFCVRRLARRMGIEVLLDAFAQVRRQHPRAVLMIGGRGAQAEALAAKARSLGLGDAVRWLGFVGESDLPLCYEAANLSVVPSQTLEGFGLVAVESLACGTPVLVTPVGGMPDVVAPLDKGLVLRGTDEVAVANGLLTALAEPGHLPTGPACREYAERNFTWGHVARRVQSVYQEAVDDFAMKGRSG